jgi:hypothetical protein
MRRQCFVQAGLDKQARPVLGEDWIRGGHHRDRSRRPPTATTASAAGKLSQYQSPAILTKIYCREKANLFGKTMAIDLPDPPTSLPQYLSEGVPKQDDQTLRDLQTWIDELLEYRHDIPAEEIKPAEGETVTNVDDSGGTTTVIKKVPCGKDACSTCPHGPYRYEVHREGDKLVWDYKGPVEAHD